MRVRTLQLRLLAAGLVALWALAAALVVLGYRPGGPLDLVVGIAAAVPTMVAVVVILRPPVVRGSAAFAGVVWLGLGAVLLLVPSIADLLGRVGRPGPQTLLPSLEAVYPWLLALGATSVLAGIGVARRASGTDASRRRRLVVAAAVATALCAGTGVFFGAAAVGNEIALRDLPATSSRYGPTDGADPIACDSAIAAGGTARLDLALAGEVDLRSIGTVALAGSRSGTDMEWTADVAGDLALGRYGAARIGEEAWTLEPRGPWTRVPPATLDDATLDLLAIAVALPPEVLPTAEDRGIETIEGARARHCRVAIDGPAFVAAFPQARWLIGDDAPIQRWRGSVDFWVFLDGTVGIVDGFVSGEPGGLAPRSLWATVRARLTATDRGEPVALSPPAP